MAQVKKLDEKRRALFPERFLPGDVFLEEGDGNELTYRLIRPHEVPVAKVVTREGRGFIKVPLDETAIVDAVRRDRDER